MLISLNGPSCFPHTHTASQKSDVPMGTCWLPGIFRGGRGISSHGIGAISSHRIGAISSHGIGAIRSHGTFAVTTPAVVPYSVDANATDYSSALTLRQLDFRLTITIFINVTGFRLPSSYLNHKHRSFWMPSLRTQQFCRKHHSFTF